MNSTRTLLLHHWRRTRLWLIPPLLLAAAYTFATGSEIAHSTHIASAWNGFQFSMVGKAIILVAGMLGLVVAMGSGEANAAFPRYAHSLPITDRRWSFCYTLYSLLAISLLAGFITTVDGHIWDKAVAKEKLRASAVAARARKAAIEKARTMPPKVPQELRRDVQPQQGLRQGFNPQEQPIAGAGRALQIMKSRFRNNPPRVIKAPAKVKRHVWDKYGRWSEFIFLVSVTFFANSLFVALTLIQRVPLRVLAIAVALVTVPSAGFAVDFYSLYHASDSSLCAVVRNIWPFAFLLAGILMMHLTAKRERHGDRSLHSVMQLLTGFAGNSQRRFASPQRALAWYDWMTFGRYFIYGTIGIAIPLAAAGLADNRDLTGVTFLPACGLAGLYVAYRLYHGDRHDHDAYLITLPVTVERISKSRLANVARVGITAFVLALLVETATIVLEWNHGLPNVSGFVLLGPICAWTLIWLVGPLFYPVIGGWLLTAGIAALVQALFLPKVQFELIAAIMGISLASLTIAAATFWLIRAAKRRGLLFGWNKRLAIALWALTAAAAVPVIVEESRGGFTIPMLILPLFLCTLPAIPFIALPLAIDRYRHR